jgi:hypothetical protein
MLGEAFNDLVSPTNHEGFNVFTWFNGHVHDNMKVIQYCMSHTIVHDIFPLNINAKPLKCAMHKGKWALDPCPHHPNRA